MDQREELVEAIRNGDSPFDAADVILSKWTLTPKRGSDTRLFTSGAITLHSGEISTWKIDCDALTDADLVTLAAMAAPLLKPFSHAMGIPRGGLRFAMALSQYATFGCDTDLIVDDVLTTGSSMEKVRASSTKPAIGVVIFARGPCPDWITPLFSLSAAK